MRLGQVSLGRNLSDKGQSRADLITLVFLKNWRRQRLARVFHSPPASRWRVANHHRARVPRQPCGQRRSLTDFAVLSSRPVPRRRHWDADGPALFGDPNIGDAKLLGYRCAGIAPDQLMEFLPSETSLHRRNFVQGFFAQPSSRSVRPRDCKANSASSSCKGR